MPVISAGDTLTCLLTAKPELTVSLVLNGVPGPEFSPKLDSCVWSLKQVYPTIHATAGVQLSYNLELSGIEPSPSSSLILDHILPLHEGPSILH